MLTFPKKKVLSSGTLFLKTVVPARSSADPRARRLLRLRRLPRDFPREFIQNFARTLRRTAPSGWGRAGIRVRAQRAVQRLLRPRLDPATGREDVAVLEVRREKKHAMTDVDLFGEPIRGLAPLPQNLDGKRRPTPKRGYAAPPGSGPKDETCRNCQHHARIAYAKVYHKCALMEKAWTGGQGTDIDTRSPACRYWEKREGAT